MASSVNGDGVGGGGKSIGESVGGLVWVRRRNGSWWPGRIVKPDELPESVAVPVRSSTPVRLLGHGVGVTSVDWYNLEKSKRVKPFRCGEYDIYIEKAKATAGTVRNAEKYVRRSDAILEALQIENTCLGKDPLEFRSRVSKLDGRRSKLAGESPTMSHGIQEDLYNGGEDSDSEDTEDSLVDLCQSSDKTNNGRGLKVQPVKGKRQRTPNETEDDLAEGYKRMRGLKDLGMGVVSKGKAAIGEGVKLVHRGSSSAFDSNAGNLMSNGSPENSSWSFQSSRRRFPAAHGHETFKRKDRRRPLTKVMENTPMVAAPVTCNRLPYSSSIPPQGICDGNASELESDGSKGFLMTKGAKISKTRTLAENYSSDSLYDVQFVDEEKDSAVIRSCSSEGPHVGVVGMQYSENCQTGAKSLSEGVNGYILTNLADFNNASQWIDEGTSKWQSKGKRKSRHISKDMKSRSDKYRDIDEDDVNFADMDLSDEFSLGLVEKVDCSGMVGSLAAHNSGILVKPTAVNQLDRFQDWGTKISGRGSRIRELTSAVQPPVKDCLPPQRLLPYRHSRMKVPSRYRDPDSPSGDLHTNSQVLDVYVRVDSYNRPQHPLVSLTSTLTGESIIGNPLTVEILDDSSYCKPGRTESDATISSGGANANMAYTLKPRSEAGKVSKRLSALRQHRSNYKSPKYRKSGLLPKTRKLSSLTSRKIREERNPLLVKCDIPAIACVPAKVAFSRISNALKGPPRPTHARYTETVNRSQRPAYVNIFEAVNRPARPVHEDIMEAVSRSPKPEQANITEAVNRSPRPVHHASERIVYPRIIEAVSGSPSPAQRA